MTKLSEGDVLAVYRESEKEAGKVQQQLLEGPCMYMPRTGSEWTKPVKKLVASEGEYLHIKLLDGSIKFSRGPTQLIVDPEKYSDVRVVSAVKIADQEL